MLSVVFYDCHAEFCSTLCSYSASSMLSVWYLVLCFIIVILNAIIILSIAASSSNIIETLSFLLLTFVSKTIQ